MYRQWKIIILLFAGCIFTFYVFYCNRSKEIKYYQETFVEYEKKIDSLYYYKYNFYLNTSLSGTNVGDMMCTDGIDSFRVSDLIKNKSMLVFRYTEHNCNLCVEKEFNTLDSLFGKDTDRLLILCSYESKRNFKLVKKKNMAPLFLVSPSNFEKSIEELNKPYYFVLHSNLKVSDFYITDEAFSESKDLYLKKVKRFLCN